MVLWLTTTPRSVSIASTILKLSGKEMLEPDGVGKGPPGRAVPGIQNGASIVIAKATGQLEGSSGPLG